LKRACWHQCAGFCPLGSKAVWIFNNLEEVKLMCVNP